MGSAGVVVGRWAVCKTFSAVRRLKRARIVHTTRVLLRMLALAVALAGPATAAPEDGQWDPTLPKIISSGAPGDPVAIANASLQATQRATQTTMELGRKFLSSLGLTGSDASVPAGAVPPARTGSTVGRRSSM
jgi:peptidoglycan DL-endopeptidase RipB